MPAVVAIMWGDHYRGPNVIESGRVSILEDHDLVEIIVDNGTLPPALPAVTQFDVSYTIGSERFTKSVKQGTTVEEFRDSLKYMHKRHSIVGVASEGCPIAGEDDLEDWLHRSVDKAFQILLAKTVQVVVDFRGTHQHFVVSESSSRKDFTKAVCVHLKLPSYKEVSVQLLGHDDW
jgi:hypothetical protein